MIITHNTNDLSTGVSRLPRATSVPRHPGFIKELVEELLDVANVARFAHDLDELDLVNALHLRLDATAMGSFLICQSLSNGYVTVA